MSMILLDTGVLSLVTHPRGGGDAASCGLWMERLLDRGFGFAVSEICDYELRRELLRADKGRSVRRLDQLVEEVEYLELDTRTMRMAAEFWSMLRKEGRPTARDAALDVDVILGAQAGALQQATGVKPIIATTNVRHLSRMADAREWQQIP